MQGLNSGHNRREGSKGISQVYRSTGKGVRHEEKARKKPPGSCTDVEAALTGCQSGPLDEIRSQASASSSATDAAPALSLPAAMPQQAVTRMAMNSKEGHTLGHTIARGFREAHKAGHHFPGDIGSPAGGEVR